MLVILLAFFLGIPALLHWLGVPTVLAFTAMAISMAIARHVLFSIETLAGAKGDLKWLTDCLFVLAITFLMYASGLSIGKRHEALGAVLVWAGIGIQIAALWVSVRKLRGAK